MLPIGALLVGSYVIGFALVYSIYNPEPPRADDPVPVVYGKSGARDAGEMGEQATDSGEMEASIEEACQRTFEHVDSNTPVEQRFPPVLAG